MSLHSHRLPFLRGDCRFFVLFSQNTFIEGKVRHVTEARERERLVPPPRFQRSRTADDPEKLVQLTQNRIDTALGRNVIIQRFVRILSRNARTAAANK